MGYLDFPCMSMLLACLLFLTSTKGEKILIVNNPAVEYQSTPRSFMRFVADVGPAGVFSEARITVRDFDDATDPDLYVKYKYNDDDLVDFKNYKWSDMSQLNTHQVVVPYNPGLPTKFSIGVFEISPFHGTFEIDMHTFVCPNANCGGGANGTCKSGKCTCLGKYNWSGSSDCRYALTDSAQYDKFYPDFVLASGGIEYFRFEASEELVTDVVYMVYREQNVGTLRLLAARGRPPTARDFDFQSIAFHGEDNARIVLPMNIWTKGTWYVAVMAGTAEFTTLSFVATKNVCPRSCSGHGDCIAATRICKCDEGYSLSDCSLASNILGDEPVSSVVHPYDSIFYQLLVPPIYSTHDVEITVQLSVTANSAYLPTIYIDKEKMPSNSNYIFTSERPLRHQQSIPLPIMRPITSGVWFVRIENREGVSIPFTVSLSLTPNCPNNCSGQGTCSNVGVCGCDVGFLGLDCSLRNSDLTEGVHWAFTSVLCIVCSIIGGMLASLFLKKANQQRDEPDYRYSRFK